MACCVVAAGVYVALNSAFQSVRFDLTNQEIAGLTEPDEKYPYCDISTVKYYVDGMTCASCTSSVEQILESIPGVTAVRVSLFSSTATVVYDPIAIAPEQIGEVLAENGFPNHVGADNAKVVNLEVENLKKLYYSVISCATITVVTYLLQKVALKVSDEIFRYIFLLLLVALASISQFRYGSYFYKRSWSSLYLRKKITMDTLVVISTSLTYALSMWYVVDYINTSDHSLLSNLSFELSTGTIFIILMGKYFEQLAKLKLNSNLSSLLSLLPRSTFLLKPGGIMVEVSCSVIKENDMVVVRPGTKIPVDGIVVEGNSYVDELALTGELLPSKKEKGDLVFAGTLNNSGSLTIRSGGTIDDSLLNSLYQLASEAQESPITKQALLDVCIAVFVPSIAVFSVITFVYWYQFSIDDARLHALSVLTIACPCALGLAAPSAITRGINVAVRRGCFVCDSGMTVLAQILGQKNNQTHIFLDKTGTITTRELRLCNVEYYTTFPKQLLWEIVLAVESFEDHPVARVVTRYAEDQLNDFLFDSSRYAIKIENYQYHHGIGILCDIEWETSPYTVFIGNKNSDGIVGKDLYIIIGDKCHASCNISNDLRPNAKEFVQALQAKGFEVSMLTGDKQERAEELANHLGVLNNVFYSCTPSYKHKIVQEARDRGQLVVMIGDGLNDTGALAAADLSVSLRTSHQLCVDNSLVILMNDDLMSFISLMDVAVAIENKINFNILFCILYNVVMIPLAMGLFIPFSIYINLEWSVTLMSLSSLFVLANTFTIA